MIGLKVPGLVRNGTDESAVLDCLYDLGSANANGTSGGLVVKWYFDGDPEPVYQWIPKRRPQDLGRLRGRLDLDHRATNDVNTMHRALNIRKPTVELSGKYTCLVSTFTEEKSVSETMVVFVPVKELMMSQSKPERGDTVRVTCKAEGVYPEPNMTLSLLRHQPGASLNHLRDEGGPPTADDDGDDDDSDEDEINVDVSSLQPLEGVTLETRRTESGVFDAVAWADVPDRILAAEDGGAHPVSFHCVLGIPNSQYSSRKSIVYYPGPSTTASTAVTHSTVEADDGSSAATASAPWLCLLLLFALTTAQHLAIRS